MNTMPTIINECEFNEIKRRYKPEFNTLFKTERCRFDFAPELGACIKEVFECSLMDEKMFAKVKSITLFLAYMYPFTKDLKRYLNMTKAYLYLFVVDDHMESDWNAKRRDQTSGRRIFAQLTSMTEKLEHRDVYVSTSDWKPFCLGYYAINEEILQDYNDVQRKRQIETIREWICGNLIEYEAIDNGLERLTVPELLEIRRQSGGPMVGFQLLEYAYDIYITEDEWSDPVMEALKEAMKNCLIFHNEIYSFEKEYIAQGFILDKTFNLVSLLAIRNDCSIEEAMTEASKLMANEESLALELLLKMKNRPGVRDELVQFMEYVNYYIGGSIKASSLMDRYNKV